MAEPACIYNIQASWSANLQQGPQYAGPLPDRQLPPKEEWMDFLGIKVGHKLIPVDLGTSYSFHSTCSNNSTDAGRLLLRKLLSRHVVFGKVDAESAA